MTASTAKIEARIKQLCCLGLGSEAIMPALLRELHGLVPSYGNSFYWVGGDGRLANIYNEVPESAEIAPLYLDEFCDSREREVHPGFTNAARAFRGVVRHDRFFSVGHRQLEHSDFYNLVMKPQGYHTVLQLYVRERGKTSGIVQLQRARNEDDFSTAEVGRFARLETFIAHGLNQRPIRDEAPLVDSGESGLIIADCNGRPLRYSPQGRRLLFLATHPQVTGAATSVRLPPAVATICKNLTAVFCDEPAAPPPVLRHRNIWGGFTFRAYWLDASQPSASRIGITVTREEPLALRLARGLRDLPLSRRQAEVAVWLAMGLTHAAIARRLGIRRNTVIAHSRWVYSKLEVHDSARLRERLLREAAEPAAGGEAIPSGTKNDIAAWH